MYARNLLETRQIAAPGSGLADIVRSSAYACTPATFRYCAKPVTDTDARGAVTHYAYSADHGSLLSETLPAPVQGAPRPETRHEYAQRYAWISNGAGGYVQAATRSGSGPRPAAAGPARRPAIRPRPARPRATRSAPITITAPTAAPTLCCCAARR